MELFDVMRTTFSAREFTDDPLPNHVLTEIFENARFAPSGGNRQGGRVIVVRQKDTRSALADLAAPAAQRYVAQVNAGESPWNPLAPTAVPAATIAETKIPPRLTESFRDAPVVLVFIVDLEVVAATDQLLDRIGLIAGASIYPFVWNVLLAARQAGFGGTITTLAVAQESELQALLSIPANFAVAAIVPLGKPIKQLTKLRRRPVEKLATLERFDGAPITA